jgi:hypothetical protein
MWSSRCPAEPDVIRQVEQNLCAAAGLLAYDFGKDGLEADHHGRRPGARLQKRAAVARREVAYALEVAPQQSDEAQREVLGERQQVILVVVAGQPAVGGNVEGRIVIARTVILLVRGADDEVGSDGRRRLPMAAEVWLARGRR